MELSIIILNYFHRDLVRELLKNLLALNLSFSYEIIVVDNASFDGVKEVAEKYPQVKFIQSQVNHGYAAGNNIGIKQAKGKYILICNPDLAFMQDAISRLYKYMEANPEVALAGPRLINADKSLQYSATDFPDWHLPFYRRTFLSNTSSGRAWLKQYLLEDRDHTKNFYVPTLFGACLIIRTSALFKVGLLDERYFMYLEDLDWSRRFWESGFKVAYVGEAEVIHLHKRESAQNNIFKILVKKTTRAHISSFLKYLWKFKGKKLPEVK